MRLARVWMRIACGFLALLLIMTGAQAEILVGSMPGNFGVSSSGAATYSIPLELPPGVVGTTPQLSLEYNSKSSLGVAGKGWDISGLSSISRCPQTKTIDGINKPLMLDASDRFCLNGERLIMVSSGSYGDIGTTYRTQAESFSRVTAYGGGEGGTLAFKVITKSGKILEYGTTADAVLKKSTGSPLRWMLSRSYDLKGHLVTYQYATSRSLGTQYLGKISYAYNLAQTDNMIDVVLNYSPTPNSDETTYVAGFSTTNRKQLSSISIQAKTPDALSKSEVRRYQLTYEVAPVTKSQRLVAVSLCMPDLSCLPGPSFGWTSYASDPLAASFQAQSAWSAEYGSAVASGGWSSNSVYPRQLIDVNGDGRPDIVGFYGTGVMVSLNTGAGFSPATLWLADFGVIQGWPDNNASPRQLVDVNGDGFPDIVGFTFNGVKVALNAGGSGFAAATLWTTEYGSAAASGGWSSNNVYPRQLVDVNGDGFPDIVGFSSAGVMASLNTGAGFLPATLWLGDFGTSQGWMDNNVTPRQLVDVNGDGFPDIVAMEANTVKVALNNGVNHFATATIWCAVFSDLAIQPPWNNDSVYPRVIVDVNGDGLPDIVGFSSAHVVVSFNTGKGFLASQYALWGDFGINQGWPDNNVTPRQLVDVNGDGFPDIVGFSPDGVKVALYSGAGTFSAATLWSTGFGTASGWNDNITSPRFVEDIKGDGRPSIVGFSSSGVSVAHPVALPQAWGFPDLLNSISPQIGGNIKINYKSMVANPVYTKAQGSFLSTYPQIDLVYPGYVVSSVDVSNGYAGFNTTLYRYGGMKAELNRGSLGFAWMESLNLVTKKKNRTEFFQDFPYTGMSKLQQSLFCNTSSVPDFSMACDLLSESINAVEEKISFGGLVHFPYVKSVTTKTYEPPSIP